MKKKERRWWRGEGEEVVGEERIVGRENGKKAVVLRKVLPQFFCY